MNFNFTKTQYNVALSAKFAIKEDQKTHFCHICFRKLISLLFQLHSASFHRNHTPALNINVGLVLSKLLPYDWRHRAKGVFE